MLAVHRPSSAVSNGDSVQIPMMIASFQKRFPSLSRDTTAARFHTHEVGPNQCCSAVIQEISAPITTVWSVVRRFDNPQAYKHFLKSCSVIGGDGGNTKEETCDFVDVIVRCNLQSLAKIAENSAAEISTFHRLLIRSDDVFKSRLNMDVRPLTHILGQVKASINMQMINITQLSEYRKDGYPSIYRKQWGPLKEDQVLNPSSYSDCIDWCLPGAPDVWNQL
ncbi:unnamed protein product [Brassica rapa subsp. narinosa]|uniref:(rape) hypothetical protein n=1 Tax=Brassica napus TaxID=3708 RepID=A0A816TAD8_BRANA|nr:unnamed protein product [Brassica napus]